jgi:hypothetical protein
MAISSPLGRAHSCGFFAGMISMVGDLPTPILRQCDPGQPPDDESAVRHGQNRMETRRLSKRC